MLEMSGGDITRMKDIAQINIYEFYNALAFNRSINQRE